MIGRDPTGFDFDFDFDVRPGKGKRLLLNPGLIHLLELDISVN